MKTLNKAIALILSLVYIFSFDVCLALDYEVAEKQPTDITGISEVIYAITNTDLEVTVDISPCNTARNVLLQRYISDTDEYKTVAEYVTEEADTAQLKISIPQKYRKRTYGKWRVFVNENDTSQSTESDFEIISRNIVDKDLSAKAVCIYCIDDNCVIYQKNMHKQLKQASLTKIMTSVILLESGKINKKAKISKKAANTEYSTPRMVKGDVYTNLAMLHAMLLPSSNGAAVAVAESVSGSTSNFIKLMNKKAKSLGLNDTHYVTVHGLDKKNHYSSAYDTAVLTAYAYSNSDTFRKIISKDSYKIKSKKKKAKTIYSTDKLKDYTVNHIGGKTGYTSKAGCCFSGIYEGKTKTYIVCVLGNKTAKSRWKDMKSLYKYIDKYGESLY